MRQDPRLPAGAIACGGRASERDLAVIQEFAAALALPSVDEQRRALLAMSEPEEGR